MIYEYLKISMLFACALCLIQGYITVGLFMMAGYMLAVAWDVLNHYLQ